MWIYICFLNKRYYKFNFMSSIDISVIVPVYNREDLISRCIRSLLNQSLNRASFEIIVVDDSSSDNTKMY